jgi:hypothetical protein
MFEGRDPTTGELLGRPHGRNAVPGFGVVLRPTKSVSILSGLGNPATGRAVLQAHHAGIREAVGYLDEHLGARRDHGGVQRVSGQGLLAVGFDHRTSEEATRCCTPIWSSPTASKGRMAAGQPWTAGVETRQVTFNRQLGRGCVAERTSWLAPVRSVFHPLPPWSIGLSFRAHADQ